jgi:acetylornithine deacetylase/succinyl-diaminopimelate desuccinylase-like protein
MTMNTERLRQFCEEMWEDSVLPALTEYIRIPNKSPSFDRDWAKHGYMDEAVRLMEAWAREAIASLPGASLEVVRLEGRTPLIFIELPATAPQKNAKDCVLLYGHLDKQPEMKGWAEGLGPWTPVRKGDKLYGRGGADDGYAMFGALTALRALADQNVPRTRCVVIIEACEESGSFDLPFYVDHLAKRIGKPSLVVCLDSGCGDYERLWLTTSLRGLSGGLLGVRVLSEGVHSGDASGIVPSSFRIARMLLSRLEDENSGEIRPREFHVEIPRDRLEQAREAASVLQRETFAKFPWVGKTQPMSDDPFELVLNRTWRPELAVIGADGLPPPGDAGNVLLPFTVLKLSLRLPPTLDAGRAERALTKLLTSDVPYGAEVGFVPGHSMRGWNAPPLAPWLDESLSRAGKAVFGAPHMQMGEGGSIPFMGMLGEKFPETQFVITGVLGPQSNAHGPNEFLHIPTAKRISQVIALVVGDHHAAVGSRQ